MYSDNVVARRTLQENVELIEELNAQRTELKDVRGKLSDLKGAMGFQRTKNVQMERELQQRRRAMSRQTLEMQKLCNQLSVGEETDAMQITGAKNVNYIVNE